MKYNNKNTHYKNIPKIVWQTYKTKNLPFEAKLAQQTWIDLNPDWKIILYDDDDIEQYIINYWDERMYKFYKKLPVGVMKADLWRYLILTTHGGVYADVDSECKIPINKWIEDLNIKNRENILVIGLENNTHFCQWSMLSSTNHPAMKFICNYILLNYENNGIDIKNEHFVHATTGPGIWTDAIKEYIGYNDNPDVILDLYNNGYINNDIIILSAEYFNNYYVRNLYGSLTFGNNYVKWTDQVKKLQKQK